jgi:hypothetical protein
MTATVVVAIVIVSLLAARRRFQESALAMALLLSASFVTLL